MKKSIFSMALVLFISLAFTSCKKDWVCQCTNQSGNQNSEVISNQTLLDARSKCKGMNYDNTTLGIHTSNSCTLQ